jgi:hypothetical protein
MQLQISFNERNKDGRFRGLRKIVLDAAHYNLSLLRDRLAMHILRASGVPAPCVNHARLYVNGEYYGVFAHIEKVDREFLERNFEKPDGDLYKKGKELTTNEQSGGDFEGGRVWFRNTSTKDAQRVGDLHQMVKAWVAESLFPDADGYWAGGLNFYTYNHPDRGFLYIPWDIDLAFDNLPADTDPFTWHKTNENFHGREHIDSVFMDPAWRKIFYDELKATNRLLSISKLQALIDRWAKQIEPHVAEDPNKPYSLEAHKTAVKRMRSYVAARSRYISALKETPVPGPEEPETPEPGSTDAGTPLTP